MMRLMHKFRSDERGAAVIELALAAPLLATFVIGMIDISNAFSRKLTLEQAAQRGIEKIMQTTVNETVDETIVNEAAAAAGVDVENVTLEYWLECDGTRKDDYHADECAETEVERRYITLALTDVYDPLLPTHLGTEADGKYHVSAQAGIRIK